MVRNMDTYEWLTFGWNRLANTHVLPRSDPQSSRDIGMRTSGSPASRPFSHFMRAQQDLSGIPVV